MSPARARIENALVRATSFLLPIRLSWTYATLIPGVLICLIRSWHSKTFAVLKSSPAIYAYLFFLITAWLSGPFGIRPAETLIGMARLSFVSLVFLPLLQLEQSKFVIPVLVLLVLGQALAAFHTVLSTIFSQIPELFFVGPVTESGQLAIVTLVCIGLIFFFRENARRKQPVLDLKISLIYNRLAWFALPLLGSALVLNLKRGPWLGVLCGGLLFLFVRARKFLLPFLLIAASLVLWVEPVRTRLVSSYDHFFIHGGRSEIWDIGADLALTYPLGIGFGNSPFLKEFSEEIPKQLSHFHSNFLNVLVETGWLGLLVYLWWIFEITRLTLRGYKKNGPFATLILALGSALIAWQVAGVVEYNFGDSEVFLVAMIVLGALCRITESQEARNPS